MEQMTLLELDPLQLCVPLHPQVEATLLASSPYPWEVHNPQTLITFAFLRLE